MPPVWNTVDGSIDMHFWMFGTLAVHEAGGKPWRTWKLMLKNAVVDNQHPKGTGARTGSWDPIGVWGRSDGGRVYSTAMLVMALQTPYRYTSWAPR